MYKRSFRFLSLILSLILLSQMLPMQVFAASANKADASEKITEAKPAHIVEELPGKRTEYSKEYRLSNGLHMAAVYPEPVHYEEDGQWAEIDNTLKLSGTSYVNTAGVWQVSFPQQMSKTNAVTITKDGYTLSFYMAGQLRSPGNLEVMSASAETLAIGSETFTLQSSQTASAQPQVIDLTKEKASVQHPETVADTIHSRLQYENIYANTNIVYDLVSNQVKESIIIDSYDAALRGYRYTLNTGDLTPVLTDSGDILLYGSDKKTVVMAMPAPYLLDDNLEYSDDVSVSLTGSKGTYTLTYTLPQSWMADEARQYPVILDPIVEAESTLDNITDVSVYESNPSAYTRSILDIGHRSQNGSMRAFVKFFNLPEFSGSDIITEARFNLYHHPTQALGAAIGVHKVLGDWEESTITWANQPAHNPIVEDYCYVGAEEGDYYWDVTEIVRDWYENGNNGLLLRASNAIEADNSGSSYRHQFYAENYSKYHRPALEITYRSSIGIEPYYTYATLGAGNAGGVYLSDSTGQITAVKEVISYASTINPFSAKLVYDSVYFVNDATQLFEPPKALGLSMSFGAGWTLDAIQKIEPETIGETTYLKYTDGDGTVHYFQKSSGIYYDEDGLGLQIEKEDDGSYTLSDSQDNKQYFTSLGDDDGRFMTSYEDNNGNKYQINYSSGKLTSITQQNREQTAITVATFTYSGDYVTAITDAAGNSYQLAYNGNKLTQAYLGTEPCAQYAYTDHRLTSITDGLRDYSLRFAYTDGKVSSYYEQSGGTIGVRCDVSHPGYTQTTYHDYGNDRTKNTADDLYTHYLFDYAGRTVNAYTTDSTQQTILGASNAVYTDNDGISKTNNRTLRTASIGLAAQKLLAYGNFENTSAYWTYSGAADATTNPRTGLRSLKATLSSASAEATASRSSMALTQGKTYTLSAYVNTADLTSVTGSGVYLKVTEGNGTVYTSEAVDYITPEDVDDGWTRISLTFTATCSGACTVSIHGTGAVGTFYADDVQLEESEAPSNYNLLENGDMQTAGYAWTMRDATSFVSGAGVNSAASEARSIKIVGTPEDETALAYQVVNINESGAQTYVLSGWAKADAVTDNVLTRSDPAYDHSKQFGLRANLTYSDGTREYFYVPFNADIATWQFASLTIVPEKTSKTVSTISVNLVYETNANTAYFDNISLVSATVEQMEYDDNGNLTSQSSTGRDALNLTYDTDGNVVKIKQGTKLEYTSKYDSTFKHRMISSSNAFTQETLSYDTVGNVIRNSLKNKTDSTSKEIVTSSEYTNSGNLISTETDDAGNTTTYGYSSGLYKALGIASSVTNAKGIETTYIADSLGRTLEMGIEDFATIKYNYNGSNLYEIQRIASGASQFYQFNYDDFGNAVSIGVGAHDAEDEVLLVEYTYGPNNGLLTQQKYANGDTVSYAYDDLGRTVAETYKNRTGQTQRVLSYTYTGDGQLYSVQDSKTGYTYQYYYDSNGSLVTCQVTDSSGNLLLLLRQNPIADRDGGKYWQLGDTVYTESFVNNDSDGSIAAFYAADGTTVTLGYDVLRRLVSASNGIYTRSFAYRDISASQTTTQVSSVSYSGLTDSPSFGYTYDALGNILTYTENGITYTYSYDDQSQLLSAVGNGKTYTYSYDNAGNILAVSDGTASHTYTYGNSVWKDLLTAYDGHTITYDASGNPLSYYNGSSWSFTWTEGRKLDTASGNGHTISYTYDLNGLRTSKTVDNTQYGYIYSDGVLLRQTGGGKTLDFIYDHNGAPYALIYRNGSAAAETYYYITNLQGDVMQLVDEDGNTAAQYSYDPYGNILSATGDMAQINPLRYRGYYYDTESGLYYLQSRYYLCDIVVPKPENP